MNKPGTGIQAALALAATAVMTWYVIPEPERYWLRLAVLGRLHALSDRLARSEGRRGMADELTGRDPGPRYGAAYQLSRARDWLAGRLEGMRP